MQTMITHNIDEIKGSGARRARWLRRLNSVLEQAVTDSDPAWRDAQARNYASLLAIVHKSGANGSLLQEAAND